jgi:hypothetical protein
MPNNESQKITSTRSNEGKDARRDFDDFDQDAELSRFRLALKRGDWRMAAELAANLDEHLSRGGPQPIAWLGPPCEYGSLTSRNREVLSRAKKMPPKRLDRVVWGFIDIGTAS